MEIHSIQSLQEQGCPLTFSMEIHAPQNGNQRVEHTPVLFRAEVTIGQADPTQVEYYAQQSAQQLTQLGKQWVQEQKQISQQQRESQGGLPFRRAAGQS